MSRDLIAQKLKSFLGKKHIIEITEENEKADYYGAGIVIFTSGCPLVYHKKYGWTECNKCLLNYNCGGGSLQFLEFCNDNKIRHEWIRPGCAAIYLPKKRTPITLYHKGNPQKAVLVEELL
jgi:hypothetical protein